MTWKQIEKSREVRLWLKDILIPASIGLVYLYSTVPDFRCWILDKKNKIASMIRH